MRKVSSKAVAWPAENLLTAAIWNNEPVNAPLDSWKKFVSSHFHENPMNSNHGLKRSLGAQPTWKQSFPGKQRKQSPPTPTNLKKKPVVVQKPAENVSPRPPTFEKPPVKVMESTENLSRSQMLPGKVRIPEFAAKKIDKFRLGPPGRINYPEFLISHASHAA